MEYNVLFLVILFELGANTNYLLANLQDDRYIAVSAIGLNWHLSAHIRC